jgi:hypothetical protein
MVQRFSQISHNYFFCPLLALKNGNVVQGVHYGLGTKSVNATTDEQRLKDWHSVLAAYDGLPIPDQTSLVYVAVPTEYKV